MTTTADEAALDYIRTYYGVPARVGGRVRYTGRADGVPADGMIVGGYGGYIQIKLDGEDYAGLYHPTWCVEYLD